MSDTSGPDPSDYSVYDADLGEIMERALHALEAEHDELDLPLGDEEKAVLAWLDDVTWPGGGQ